MKEIKRRIQSLIQKIRSTDNPKEQHEIKMAIDLLEEELWKK